MPRIYTSASDPIDFCNRCFPSNARAKEQYYNVGHGPDGRGNCFEYQADHPDYAGESYTCTKCGKLLTTKDNGY